MIDIIENEKPRLIQTGRGFSVLYRNKYLYSKYNPQQAMAAQVSALECADSMLVLCFSPVLGYGLQELSQRLSASSAILAVECDQLLMRFSLENAAPACFTDERFFYIRTDSVSEVMKKIESLPAFPFKKCISISCSGGVQLYRTFYDTVRLYAGEVISRFWKNRITLMHLGRNYVHNTFRNLLSLADNCGVSMQCGAAAWDNNCRFRLLTDNDRIYKPVLVAGAGPSLDSARDFLIKNRNAFFLLAVDAAAAALLPEIRPDAVVLVESQYWIDSAFIGFKKYGIPVFADITASPRALRACSGSISFFCTEYAQLRYLSSLYQALQPLILQPLGSVGLTAVQLALTLAAPSLPVLHTGLDFAWQSGFTHAAGASPIKKLLAETNRIESLYKLNVSADVRQISGKQGASYRTTPVLTGYADLYRHIFAGNNRLIDIGRVGCSLTACSPVGQAEAEKLLTDAYKRFADTETDFEALRCRGDRQTVQTYLTGEAESLTALTGHLQGKCRLSDDALEQLLAERDYLYSHFPDAVRGYSLNLGFLKRISIEAAYILKLIGSR